MLFVLIGVSAALTFALLVSLHRKLDALPARVWIIDDLRARRAPHLDPSDAELGAALQAPAAESDERQTIEMPGSLPSVTPPPQPAEEEDSDELTTIATRPFTGMEITSDRTPASRPRPSPHAPAIMPPGSATFLPPGPAQLAAGLTRPSARPLSATRTPESTPWAEARPRSTTMLGLAAPSGPRRAQSSAPTLLSMQAVAPSTGRPAPTIGIESEAGEPREGGAA